LLLPNALVGQFLVKVTYLMASSLILTGGLQLFFIRLHRLSTALEDLEYDTFMLSSR
jgi:uncharacterized membrane protein